jgi:hypothetical protein
MEELSTTSAENSQAEQNFGDRHLGHATTGEKRLAMACTCLQIMGLFLQVLLFWCWAKVRKKEDDEELTLFIFVPDIVSCLLVLPFNIALVTSEDGFRAWCFGALGMQAVPVIVFVTQITTFVGICIYTWQRHSVVCQQQSLQTLPCLAVIVFSSLVAFGLSLWCVLAENAQVTVGQSGVYVMIDWTKRTTPNMLAGSCVLLHGYVGFVLIGYTYYKIDKKVGKLLRKLLSPSPANARNVSKDHLTGKAKAPRRPERDATELAEPCTTAEAFQRSWADSTSERQRRLLLRSALIITMYAIAWCPYGMLITFELITSTYVSATMDSICALLVLTLPTNNFIIFVCTNREYARLLRKAVSFH